jgi:hypothetical protein
MGFQVSQHVFLGDASTLAAALNLVQIQTVLAGDFGHDRGDETQVAVAPGVNNSFGDGDRWS